MLDIEREETFGVAESPERLDTEFLALIVYIASRGKIHRSRSLLHGAHSDPVVGHLEGQSQGKQLEDPRCSVSHLNWLDLKYMGQITLCFRSRCATRHSFAAMFSAKSCCSSSSLGWLVFKRMEATSWAFGICEIETVLAVLCVDGTSWNCESLFPEARGP